MRLVAALAVAFAAVLPSACGSGPTSRCEDVCEREARCVEEVNEASEHAAPAAARSPRQKLDTGECAASCKALERDPEGKELVRKHAECVQAASGCEAIVACD
jgi:hypothetical protein